MKKSHVITIYLLNLLLNSYSLTPLLGANNDFQKKEISSLNTSPLFGDYLVGLNIFNQLTGKNIKYEKFKRTILKDIEVKAIPSNNKAKNKLLNTPSEFYEVLRPVPQNTIEETVVEEYYELIENGKIYDGPLTFNSSNEVFATLTEAITNLNNRGVSGNVRFLLTDVLYNEVAAMVINISGNDTTNSSRTVTIKPNVNVSSAMITTTTNNPVFTVNESYIIFDGANSIGGSTRNMIITNSGNSSSSGTAFISNVRNVIFKNLVCFTMSSATSFNLLFDNVNNGLVENCELRKATIAIQAQNNCNNFTAINNDVGSQVTGEKIQNLGIGIISSTNFTLEKNRIIGLERPYSSTIGTFGSVIGILIGNQSGGINPSNGIISQNEIRNIKHTGIDLYAYSALGIKLSGLGLNSNITIANNFISDILGDGDAGIFFNPHGIFIDQGGGYNIYNNSVNLSGTVNNSGLWNPAYTGALSIYPGSVIPSNLDIRNNIFTNSQTIGYPGSKAYAIYCGISNTAFSKIDYNNYYASGPNAMLGYLGSDKNTITAWRAATGKDIYSITQAVNFVSAQDLHLTGASIGDGNLTVPQIPGITTDFDNEARHPYYQYMGADEITTSPLALKLNLKVLIEGFYANGGMQDTVTVYFTRTTPPYTKSLGYKAFSSATGNDFYFPKEAGVASYYIVVNHRNSIETWSASPITFLFPSLEANYDFTTAATKAYGDNLVLKSGKYCIWSGDINQDGAIDAIDRSNAWNDRNLSGYLATDVNGDGTVDALDRSMCWNNRNNIKKWPGEVIMQSIKINEVKIED